MELAQRLVDFAEAGNQQKIQLVNGDILQGWVMEITDQALLISTGFSDKHGQDYWIDLDDIKTAQLWYWDNRSRQWTAFDI